jgi:hypothetical protein
MNDQESLNKESEHQPTRGEIITSPDKSPARRVGTGRMLLRLVIGSAMIGRDEINRRFQESQSRTHIPPVILNDETPVETDADRTRYAILGAMANSSTALERNLSTLGRMTNKVFRGIKRAARPVTDSRLMNPIQHQYQRFTERGEAVISEWVAAGRKEEYLSRQLAQDTAIEAIEETLDYLAESPEMDELVKQQSGDLIDDVFEDVFDDVFDDIGGSTSRAGLIMTEWFNNVILRRPSREPESKPEADLPAQAPSRKK